MLFESRIYRSEQSRLKNPYTWIVKQEEPVKDEKRSKVPRPLTPALDKSVKQATKDFCDWVTSLASVQYLKPSISHMLISFNESL